ncbi:MAG: SpoIIE family protein phosphatase [Ignavibacteriales bacterium]|nr:SpoIIE family protein phosphatase [Ignavibacteriales bacterium]
MSRLKKAALLIASGTLLLLVFMYDVVRLTVELGDGGIALLREAMVVAAMFCIYAFMREQARKGIGAAIKEIGRLLMFLVSSVLVAAIVGVLPGLGFSEGTDQALPQNSVTAFFSLAVSVVVGVASILSLLTVKELVYHKRKRGTRRNFLTYLVLLFATAAFSLPMFANDLAFLGTTSFVLAVIMIVVNAFRQNWIVYLSRREKIYCIIYSALLFAAFLALSLILSNRTFLQKAMLFFSGPMERFVLLNSMYGAVYFGMSFITTLFHLPTAEAYERKQSELSSLHNLGRLVTQVFDFKDLVNTVTHVTREVSGARSAWLELIRDSPKASVVEVVSANNITAGEIETVMSNPEYSPRQFVIESKRSLMIDEVGVDRRTRHLKGLGLPIASLLSIPLVSHGSLIGVLHATKDIAYGFDQDDSDVLTTLADHVTIAIDNARLIEQSLERERLKQELMVARDMQKRLLPQRFPENPAMEVAAHSEPSLEVGGDYFDFVHLDEKTIGIVVGDVSGKGVSAAFYMAEVKGIFQSLSKMTRSPRELLIWANQTLRENLERKAFISAVYAVFELATSRVVLARAGHCPMVLVSDGMNRLIRPNGLGLGLTDGELFERSTEETVLTLKRGDVCLLYTDGITEARNPEGVEFGYDRLVDLAVRIKDLPAVDIQNRILSEIGTYCGKTGPGDDLTLVVVKWHGTKSEG